MKQPYCLAAQVMNHPGAADLGALVATGKDYCTVFYEYSVMKEMINDTSNNEG
jgi:hypothetical protein